MEKKKRRPFPEEVKRQAVERIAAEAARHGAALSAADLAAGAPDWCGTISRGLDGVDLHEIPPSGQGIAACTALGMLSHTGVRDRAAEDDAALAGAQRAQLLERAVPRGLDPGEQGAGLRLDPP